MCVSVRVIEGERAKYRDRDKPIRLHITQSVITWTNFGHFPHALLKLSLHPYNGLLLEHTRIQIAKHVEGHKYSEV